MLLVLLAASNLPEPGSNGGTAVAAVFGEERGCAVAMVATVEAEDSAGATWSLATRPPRELPRCRTVRGYGLPAPRAPTARAPSC